MKYFNQKLKNIINFRVIENVMILFHFQKHVLNNEGMFSAKNITFEKMIVQTIKMQIANEKKKKLQFYTSVY